MRLAVLLCVTTLILMACNEQASDCPAIWKLDRNDIATYALLDSSRLKMEAWNSTTPNAITLSQDGLIGDFEISIDLLSFEWDSLVAPQFRMEVYNQNVPTEGISGVSINPSAFYTYVGTPENRDMRIIHGYAGPITISRTAGIVSCSASFGGVELSFSDTLHTQDMSVRLVLGTTESSTNETYVQLDNFSVSSSSAAQPDLFECESWQ